MIFVVERAGTGARPYFAAVQDTPLTNPMVLQYENVCIGEIQFIKERSIWHRRGGPLCPPFPVATPPLVSHNIHLIADSTDIVRCGRFDRSP